MAGASGENFLDDIMDITLITVLSAVVGARLYFVIFFGGFVETGGTFWENLEGTLYNIIAIWNGGLAIYGGIIAGAPCGLSGFAA